MEDLSGKTALELLLPKLVTTNDSYQIISYKGIGHLPRDMNENSDPRKRILLNNLPRILRGYGRAYSEVDVAQRPTVIIVCDLDNRSFDGFMAELESLLLSCTPRPNARFCLAIEEGEAWFLGDIPAVKSAFPNAKDSVLNSYVNDSICGTWEKLADAVFPGGSGALIRKGHSRIGSEKSEWARSISPYMNVDANRSPSFCRFRDQIRASCSA